MRAVRSPDATCRARPTARTSGRVMPRVSSTPKTAPQARASKPMPTSSRRASAYTVSMRASASANKVSWYATVASTAAT